jgi:uncharacterized protein (TIGR03086 family)
MNEATAFRRASQGFVQRTQNIGPDQWSAPTPCTEWDVRALVNHVVGEYLWVPELLAGRTIAEVGNRFDGDVLGDDPLQALVEAQRSALAAVEAPQALDGSVHLSFGDTPAAAYAMQMAIDSTIHSWDVARGVGADEALDPELVDVVYAELQRTGEDWRAGGAFGPAKPAADGSAQARLLALTGR